MIVDKNRCYYNEHDVAFNIICDLRRDDKEFGGKYPYFIDRLYEAIYSPQIYHQTFHGNGD